jgi:hypothetical protein
VSFGLDFEYERGETNEKKCVEREFDVLYLFSLFLSSSFNLHLVEARGSAMYKYRTRSRPIHEYWSLVQVSMLELHTKSVVCKFCD